VKTRGRAALSFHFAPLGDANRNLNALTIADTPGLAFEFETLRKIAQACCAVVLGGFSRSLPLSSRAAATARALSWALLFEVFHRNSD
jgi:hypothetical protein